MTSFERFRFTIATNKIISKIFEELKSDGFATGIQVLKPFQMEVIERLSNTDKHVICVVPTGMGKTICMREFPFIYDDRFLCFNQSDNHSDKVTLLPIHLVVWTICCHMSKVWTLLFGHALAYFAAICQNKGKKLHFSQFRLYSR